MRLLKAGCFGLLKVILFLILWLSVGFIADYIHQVGRITMFTCGAIFMVVWDAIEDSMLANPYIKKEAPK